MPPWACLFGLLLGISDAEMQDAHSLKVRAALENVPVAIKCVAQSARAAGFEEQAVYEIQVAVDEACANVVQHAYAGMEPGYMEVSCSLDGRTLVIRVRDWGRGFDPNEIKDPDVTTPLEERSLGGLGLYLIRQYMEQVRYTFDPERGNELLMTKSLNTAL